MGNFLHRTTRNYLQSVPPGELPEDVANYISDPDLSSVSGFGSQYWIVTGDVVTLMNQAARDAVDAAALEDIRDSAASQLDHLEDVTRGLALAILGEINILRAVAALPDRTIAQLKTSVRSHLGS